MVRKKRALRVFNDPEYLKRQEELSITKVELYPTSDYPCPHPCLALSHKEVTHLTDPKGHEPYTRVHKRSGWTVSGQVIHKYETRGISGGIMPYWVNDFEAVHEEFGVVKGDFEACVRATSMEAFRHFWEHHGPVFWHWNDKRVVPARNYELPF